MTDSKGFRLLIYVKQIKDDRKVAFSVTLLYSEFFLLALDHENSLLVQGVEFVFRQSGKAA